MGVFTWIGDQFEKGYEWVAGIGDEIKAWLDEITENIRKEIAKIKEDIITQLRVWRHKTNKALAEWFNSTLGFWVSIGVVVASVVTVGVLGATGALAPILDTIGSTVEGFEAVLQGLASELHLDVVFTINDLLQTLIPQYREIWQELYTAIGGIAEELDLGPGVIANSMRNMNMVIASTYALLGFPPETAEVQYYLNSADTWQRLDENFEKYARNPQAVFDDIREWILVPSLENVSEFRRNVDESIGTINESLQTFGDNLVALQDAVNETIDELPDEIEAAINSHVGPALDTVNTFIENQVVPAIEKIDEINSVLVDFADREQARYDKLNQYVNNKMNSVLSWNELSNPEKHLVKFAINNVLTVEDTDRITNANEAADNKIAEILTDKEAKIAKRYEIDPNSINTTAVIRPREVQKPSSSAWFKGEY